MNDPEAAVAPSTFGRVKVCPSDFVVSECTVATGGSGDYIRYRVRKQGLTTFEAVDAIADHLGCPPTVIGYAGLKDEDGVTEQSVTIPSAVAVASHGDLLPRDGGRTLHLTPEGAAARRLRVGDVIGNIFTVIVRDLDEALCAAVTRLSAEDQVFLNYYDVQRFGVPTGPKTSHCIGGAIIEGQFATALRLLAGSRAAEASSAAAWVGQPEEFFARLDGRKLAFYMSAHESAKWNQSLADVFCRTGAAGRTRDHEGIKVVLPRSSRDAREVALETPSLPLITHRLDEANSVAAAVRSRTTAVQVRARCSVETDPLFPGRHFVRLAFFLPSGCYGTMVVETLLGYADTSAS